MVWVVNDHLNCSTKPASWTLCSFDVINGSVLGMMGLVGIVLNTLVMYIIVIAGVKIPGKQKYFLANLTVTDLLLAVCAVFRGFGSVSEKFFIGGYKLTPWCILFALMLNVASFVNSCALVPITLERYLAVCFPFYHRGIMTKRNCLIMCALTWVPNTVFFAIEVISYSMPGDTTLDIKWNQNYHRCTYRHFDPELLVKEIVCFVIPLIVIIVCYGSIIWILIKNKIQTKRVLIITFLIVITGIISWLPTVIIGIGSINMNYKVSHIITMTFWYWIVISDPLIYIFGFPTVQKYLWEMLLCKPHPTSSQYLSTTSMSFGESA